MTRGQKLVDRIFRALWRVTFVWRCPHVELLTVNRKDRRGRECMRCLKFFPAAGAPSATSLVLTGHVSPRTAETLVEFDRAMEQS